MPAQQPDEIANSVDFISFADIESDANSSNDDASDLGIIDREIRARSGSSPRPKIGKRKRGQVQTDSESDSSVVSMDMGEGDNSDAGATPKSLEEGEIMPLDETKAGHREEYLYCYDGQPLPQWLVGRKRLGRGQNPSINTMLNEEVETFVQYISPTPEEHQLRQWVVLKLQRSLDRLYSAKEGLEAKVEVFGSFETMLYLPTGDIDVTVVIRDKKSGRMVDVPNMSKLLYRMAGLLKKTGFSKSCEVIAKARVPIIKTNEAITGIAIDISVNAVSGLGSASIVRDFVEKSYPGSLRPMVLVIKQFLLQRGMNEVYTGGMGSYAVVLLLVSLLQIHPKCQSGEIDPAKNLGVLLCEFFELYGKRFNYERVGISVAGGGRYIDKRTVGFLQERQPYLLSIEDPHDATNDVTKGTFGIKRIKHTFSGAFDLLCNAIYTYHQVRANGYALHEDIPDLGSGKKHQRRSKASPDRSRKRGRPIVSRYSIDPYAPVSFLSSILQIPSSTTKFRRKMAEIFYSNKFQNELGVTFNPDFMLSGPSWESELALSDKRAYVEGKGHASSRYAKDMSELKFDFASKDREPAMPPPARQQGPIYISDSEDDSEHREGYGDGITMNITDGRNDTAAATLELASSPQSRTVSSSNDDETKGIPPPPRIRPRMPQHWAAGATTRGGRGGGGKRSGLKRGGKFRQARLANKK
ncbi:hypothetical protein EV182_000734 [Spiromyces aspiralis]|uniref:Uncharacterized protein n=1 Tax=Spiromyces aspiralis TaxID=68401 RepID=A0ACC1HTZ5_9FUNG|nr:hypothetical protein EV182_000734 [Spiromyces aspiralis]